MLTLQYAIHNKQDQDKAKIIDVAKQYFQTKIDAAKFIFTPAEVREFFQYLLKCAPFSGETVDSKEWGERVNDLLSKWPLWKNRTFHRGYTIHGQPTIEVIHLGEFFNSLKGYLYSSVAPYSINTLLTSIQGNLIDAVSADDATYDALDAYVAMSSFQKKALEQDVQKALETKFSDELKNLMHVDNNEQAPPFIGSLELGVSLQKAASSIPTADQINKPINSSKQTMLHVSSCAYTCNHAPDYVAKLLEMGSDSTLIDTFGLTPVQCAVLSNENSQIGKDILLVYLKANKVSKADWQFACQHKFDDAAVKIKSTLNERNVL